MIKRTDENKNITYFKNLKDAADALNTNLESWKVQLTIANAIIHRKRAYKSFWNVEKRK